MYCKMSYTTEQFVSVKEKYCILHNFEASSLTWNFYIFNLKKKKLNFFFNLCDFRKNPWKTNAWQTLYSNLTDLCLQEMEGECKKMQKEAEEDFGDGITARHPQYCIIQMYTVPKLYHICIVPKII